MNGETERSLMLRDRKITYLLRRKRVKNINLHVYPDGGVIVSAPSRVPIYAVEAFLREKSDFILSALDKFDAARRSAPKPTRYEDGDKLLLLGEVITLRLKEGGEEYATVHRPYLDIVVRDTSDTEAKRRLLEDFYRRTCAEVFGELIDKLCPLLERYGVTKPRLRLRTMKSRWGSCAPHNHTVTLNTKLIEAPFECVEYVVLHELCHFVHPNHSAQFHALVASFMPDWKRRRQRLNNAPIILHT